MRSLALLSAACEPLVRISQKPLAAGQRPQAASFFSSGISRQLEWVGFDQRPDNPEPSAVEPENRDLLELLCERHRLVLRHHDSNAALTVRSVRRAGIDFEEPVTARFQPLIELAAPLFVLGR